MKMRMLTILAAGIGVTLSALGPARAAAFTANEYVTYGQADWPTNSTAEAILVNDFDIAFPALEVTVGIGNYIEFTSPGPIAGYLPSNGPAAPLTSIGSNPTSSASTSSGTYGGDVTALVLNVGFSAAGVLPGTSSIPFGNLLLMGFSGSLSGLNGMTVSDFLTLNETALGGGSIPYAISDLDPYLQQVNGSFALGEVTSLASEHLEFAPTVTPLPAALLLFATGLGALGFFGWRRKRKNATAIAAA